MIISHRGEWSTAPENSVAAILQAADAGADTAEIDVQQTRQGTLNLMHDGSTDRMTNKTGNTVDVCLLPR